MVQYHEEEDDDSERDLGNSDPTLPNWITQPQVAVPLRLK